MNAIPEVAALMTVSGLAAESELLEVRSVRDGMLVRTSSADFRLSEVSCPSVGAAGWRVIDIAPELFADPPMRSHGVAIGADKMLAIDDPESFYLLCVLLCRSVDSVDLAALAERYLASGPPRHVIEDGGESLPVSSIDHRSMPAVFPPDWKCDEDPIDMRLGYDTWYVEGEGGICLERWVMNARESAVVLSSTLLARGLRWRPSEG